VEPNTSSGVELNNHRNSLAHASGERRNDVYGRMRTIASRLTPAEINGLAAYYRAGFK
jgi:hypothetical protein